MVRPDCPYVQFVAAARVTITEKFVVEVINERKRDRSQVSGGKSEWVPRARLLLGHVLVLCSGRFEVRWVHGGSIGSSLDRSDSSPPPWDALLSLL